MINILILIFTTVSFFISCSSLFAQENYSLVKRGEYEEWYEKPAFVKDAKVSGEFHLRMFNSRGKDFSNEKDNYFRQDFILRFRSETQSNVSMNLAIANQPYSVGDDRGSYYSRVEEERQQGVDSSGDDKNGDILLRVDEAFLEYNHNPSAVFRLGKHYIAPGDREGLIYKGKVSAITQQCSAGTWCYYFGGAQIGRNDHDNLYWLNLVYPIFESGNYRSDPWWEENEDLTHIKERYENALYFEGYRMFHNEFDVPLATYGGNTFRTSGNPVTGGSDVSKHQLKEPNTKRLVYYDADMEYWGVNILWIFHDLEIKYKYSRLSGDKHFHTGTREVGIKDEVIDTTGTHSKRNVEGFVHFLKVREIIFESWRLGFDYFSATGRKSSRTQNSDGTYSVDTSDLYPWNYTDFGFYEVNRGTFGDANIYFDGYLGTGQGHSINNLTYYDVNLSYRGDKLLKAFNMSLYKFERTEDVLNDEVEFVKNIGYELDFEFTWTLENNLYLQTDFNWFQVDGAYVKNDNLTPTSKKIDDFTSINLGIHYRF